jgi:large subunit ribosomal protein L15
MASTKAADAAVASAGAAGGQAKSDGHATGGKAGLKVHHLRPAPGAHKPKTRVGRGEGSKGKTAGRGTKGSKARTSISPAFEGGQMPLHRRLPKLKGFSNARFKVTYQVVNLDRLAELYPSGGDVTPADLAARGAVRSGGLVVPGTGEAVSGLRVAAHAFSPAAIEKITSAGGTATKL